jgi:hypothetical protein
VVSIETGAMRTIGDGLPADSVTGWKPIGLTADRSAVLVLINNVRQSVWGGLWKVPLGEGPAVQLTSLPSMIRKIGQPMGSWLSPDARRILYRSGELSWGLWVLSDPRLR